jgi:hypothetical protein
MILSLLVVRLHAFTDTMPNVADLTPPPHHVFSRQEQWATMSTYACWKMLLGITRKESQNHSIIGEIYSNQMAQRLQEVMDSTQRIFRKVQPHLSSYCLTTEWTMFTFTFFNKKYRHDVNLP